MAFWKCQCGWCMICMHDHCIFLFLNPPLLCWPPFSCTCLFYPWKKQNWMFTFCSGEREELNILWKIQKIKQEIFVHPLLFLGAHGLTLPCRHPGLNQLLPHNPPCLFLRVLSLFHSAPIKKWFWTSKKRNHRNFKLYSYFLWAYTYKRLKSDESLWKPCEQSYRFPAWQGKMQMLFPQFFNPFFMLLSQLFLFIF